MSQKRLIEKFFTSIENNPAVAFVEAITSSGVRYLLDPDTVQLYVDEGVVYGQLLDQAISADMVWGTWTEGSTVTTDMYYDTTAKITHFDRTRPDSVMLPILTSTFTVHYTKA